MSGTQPLGRPISSWKTMLHWPSLISATTTLALHRGTDLSRIWGVRWPSSLRIRISHADLSEGPTWSMWLVMGVERSIRLLSFTRNGPTGGFHVLWNLKYGQFRPCQAAVPFVRATQACHSSKSFTSLQIHIESNRLERQFLSGETSCWAC